MRTNANHDATEVLKNANDFFDADAIDSGRVRCVCGRGRWESACRRAVDGAEQAGPHEQDQAATNKVKSRLIIEAVGVKDKKGNPIEGLTAKDFTITEDGVAQTIKIWNTRC